VVDELLKTLRQRPAAAWVEKLKDAGVPASLINTVDEVLEEQQVRDVAQLAAVPHPSVKDFASVHTPLTFDGQRLPIRRRPPELNGDGEDVLRELGLGTGELPDA
jgi:crotonobetainyl-CoA:carnitine CoA-transferase CaiB-like acyl-CoA transferase